MGAITDVVRRYIPSTYSAMIGQSGVTDFYSITQLQDLADYVQARLFSTVPGSTNEATLWDVKQRELLGMLTTLQFIPVAVEFWGEQMSSETTTGTNETVTWRDRRPDLWKIFNQLQIDANQLAIDIGIPFSQTKAVIPQVSQGDGTQRILHTTEPDFFPKLHSRRDRRFSEPGLLWTEPFQVPVFNP